MVGMIYFIWKVCYSKTWMDSKFSSMTWKCTLVFSGWPALVITRAYCIYTSNCLLLFYITEWPGRPYWPDVTLVHSICLYTLTLHYTLCACNWLCGSLRTIQLFTTSLGSTPVTHNVNDNSTGRTIRVPLLPYCSSTNLIQQDSTSCTRGHFYQTSGLPSARPSGEPPTPSHPVIHTQDRC